MVQTQLGMRQCHREIQQSSAAVPSPQPPFHALPALAAPALQGTHVSGAQAVPFAPPGKGLRAANKMTAQPPGGRGRCSESACTTRTLRF
ncbi:hypothetical protein XFF6992_370162 [Xanthomonas citri pv. fuscans]|nr:hypothetical protein XFF6992_370162 [Xanthomonas citri pv. fuscans]SOO35904.1 hypothetical protein XFF6994_6050001 [Xanthomonas citri pv. fuscans]